MVPMAKRFFHNLCRFHINPHVFTGHREGLRGKPVWNGRKTAGGEVVISEQGDVKRAIGVYSDPINIAARMEQKAKELKQVVILSSEIVENAGDSGFDFDYLGEETIKGITEPIKVYTVGGIRQ